MQLAIWIGLLVEKLTVMEEVGRTRMLVKMLVGSLIRIEWLVGLEMVRLFYG